MLRITSLLFCIVLTACSARPAITPTPVPIATATRSASFDCSPPSSWTIEYHRTGGIAGFDQMLTLESTGELAIKSEKPPGEMETKLPPDELKQIAGLLADVCPFEVTSSQGVCADCFQYQFEIQMDSRFFSVQATDVTLSPEMQKLTDVFNRYLQLSSSK